MRPPEAFARRRSVAAAVDADLSVHMAGDSGSGSTAPAMTYFLAAEDEIDAAVESSCGAGFHLRELIASSQPQPSQHRRVEATTVEVEAAAVVASSSTPLSRDDGHVRREDHEDDSRPAPVDVPSISHRPRTPAATRHDLNLDHDRDLVRSICSPSLSRPSTPSLFGTPGPASLSALSSPSSRHNSLASSFLDDSEPDPVVLPEGGEHGRFGSFDGSHHHIHQIAASSPPSLAASALSIATADDSRMMDSGSAPQLIMPSIQMPSRRPFTATGRQLGRLKVLIAGDTGLGKTSLIKAIVQSCQHIVHVDHIAPASTVGRRRSAPASRPALGHAHTHRRPSRFSPPDQSTGKITEIYASTKPYPAWWSELDDSRAPTKRKSLGDNVLDRNICFVDTPGYSGQTSVMDAITPVVQYVESFLHRLRSNALSDADLVSLLTGDGGLSIDVVFYLVSGDLKPADIEYLRLLAPLTNIIPLLARADTIASETEVAWAKERMAKQLLEANIQPFAFAAPATALVLPYAISSTPGVDLDTMDASLLMSPDYVQPLVPTELAQLVDRVFCPDGASRLRHAAARKSVQWRKCGLDADAGSSLLLSSPSSPPVPSRPQHLYRPLNLNLSLARMADHTQREERLAQIRLATWAAELQRHLDSERARFENLARNERAVWLTERLSECVQDGSLVAVAADHRSRSQSQGHGLKRHDTRTHHGYRADLFGQNKKKSRRPWSTRSVSASLCHEDPLGLLEVTAGLRARGWLVLEVLGSLSMLGGMALWVARYNYHLQLYGWVVDEWAKFWGGGR
ncbi:heat shock protein [Grosmannia clavigera kw1407]|uniref:Heat shock protein n=1 Tax=Grosmannia clavigera (strain kw1407 / UAMH 11150) TaxID=655863 RepID=F0XUD2_GROCL|nr:heat shock protein [Grosmannia clavigera kw1407]EFW98894.1 heat shock protein [Grosmannia clavigera kw1407]